MTGAAGYLLDTNVASETRRTRPDERVVSFLTSVDAAKLFISVLTLGELRRGVEMKRQSDPEVAAQIGAWVDGIELTFADRILPVDALVARLWGELSADRKRPVVDTLIAATALVRDLTLVTRNGGDLAGIAVPILDPWQATTMG